MDTLPQPDSPVVDRVTDKEGVTREVKDDPRIKAFMACDAILSKSPLGPASQVAVAVMVLAAAAMRTNAEHPQVGRGKLINALTDDVRKALQREIPL